MTPFALVEWYLYGVLVVVVVIAAVVISLIAFAIRERFKRRRR